MRIADVMTRELPTLPPDCSIRQAAAEMTERGVKALPICEGERLVGIVTDWDLAKAVANGEDLESLRIASVMSTDLVEAPPDATFADAAHLMAEREVHHLLVSSDGRFEGMVHLDVEWSELTESLSGAPMATFAARI
jgi:CBS domain-containing protein